MKIMKRFLTLALSFLLMLSPMNRQLMAESEIPENLFGNLAEDAGQQLTGGGSPLEDAPAQTVTGIDSALLRMMGGIDALTPEPAVSEPADGTGSSGEGTDGWLFDETTAGYAGTWVYFEDGFRIYLPSDWNVYDPSDEQKQGGCLYQAGDVNAGSDPTKPFISVNYGDAGANGITGLEELQSGLEQSGYGIDGITTVNGIPCVTYHLSSDDMSGLMFFGPYDSDLMFAVVGYRCSGNMDLMRNILTSVSLR